MIAAQFELPFTSTLPASKEVELPIPTSCTIPRLELPKSSGLVLANEKFRLSVPRRGHVLSSVVEVYAEPIRAAVLALEGSLAKKDCVAVREFILFPQSKDFHTDPVRSRAEMFAWAIVSMWVVGIAVEELPVTASLTDAEGWFFGVHPSESLTRLASDEAILKAESALASHAVPSVYLELLPYLLDPHGPGSRLSVRRNPATRKVQARKRAEGVFYTPADVAEYMATACLSDLSREAPPTVFDPACGTGVFLRAALKEICRRHPGRKAFTLAADCLFGADIDPWPIDAAAFVLVADCWTSLVEQGKSPAEGWQRLRSNLACVDTLRIDRGSSVSASDTDDDNLTGGDRVPIAQLFPALKRGPTVILGNPPYADVGRRSDLADLGRVYETLAAKPGPTAEIYLPFIEQMIRLADQDTCAGALVLPLSIACNVGRQFSATRELISKTRGHWRFAFFDREPHALFGEDVKTRNAIVVWARNSSHKNSFLATGPLLKWRGNSRAAMFESLQFTAVGVDIRAGIPKIDGDIQAAALRVLGAQWGRLEQVVRGIERFNLADTPTADDHTLFVGPTAYNFLNVFMKPDIGMALEVNALSEHALHAVKCSSRKDAFTVFAILSSHLAYWWWHTHGDGFHVSRRFLAELPFGLEILSPIEDMLADRGEHLWLSIKKRPIISLNRGRTSLAYSPRGYDDVRRDIDQMLARLVGLKETFVDELQQFTARTVAATLRKQVATEIEEQERK